MDACGNTTPEEKKEMKKVKFKVPSRDEGKQLIQEVGKTLGVQVSEIEADLRIDNEKIYFNCHLYFEDEAFVMIKYHDESLESKIEKLYKKYL